MKRNIKEKHFIHSSYDRKTDKVFVKERVVYDDGTEEPDVVVYDNPKRAVFITKEQFRNHQYKLERESLDRLDKVIVAERDKNDTLAKIFGMKKGKRYIPQAEIYANPYIYGANIDIEALIKMKYADRVGHDKGVVPRVGFLDVENDVDTQEITLNSYLASDGTCYTAVLREMMYKLDGKGNRVKVSEEEFTREVKRQLDEYLITDNFNDKVSEMGLPEYKFNFGFCDNSTEMMAFIFKAIHHHQDDFIGTWSDHDIQMIMGNIKERTQFNVADFFCSRKAREQGAGWFKWDSGERSMKDSDHWTHRWSWVDSTCPAQFLNLMAIYSHMRKTAPFRDSYKLDDILNEFIGAGKFPKISEDHKFMATNHFTEYTAYNIFDVVGLDLLEKVNKDVTGFFVLCAKSPVSRFNRAVITTHNDLYDYNLKKGYVLSVPSPAEKYSVIHGYFPSQGGTVLPPYLYGGPSVEIS